MADPNRDRLAGHVFISYVHEDAIRAGNLAEALKQIGIPVWRDKADLWPGEDWRTRIRCAITNDALVFLACFSRNSLARERSYQNEELMLAVDQMRLRQPGEPWLIPIRFDDCHIPDIDIGGGRSLGSIQRVDFFGDQLHEGSARLADAIARILNRGPASSPIPALLAKARQAALSGDMNGARAALATARARAKDPHLEQAEPAILAVAALVDSLAGEHRAAEMTYCHIRGILIELGMPAEAVLYEAHAAREIFKQGKVTDAGTALARLINGTANLDLRTQVMTEALSARIAAVSGRAAHVVDSAEATAKLSEQTDDLHLQGDCYTDLAIIAAQAGRQADAAGAASTALDRYQAAGATRPAIRAQRLLAGLIRD